NLRDLNMWYRYWANERGIVHLILSETAPIFGLGMVVRPDSADPGLANMQWVPVSAGHTAICKPQDDTQDIYVHVRHFINRSVERPKRLADAVAEGVRKGLKEARIEERTILELAGRLKPNEKLDFDQAVKELTAAVGIAIEVSEKGERGSNLGDHVDTV